jgi:hypothetical protein
VGHGGRRDQRIVAPPAAFLPDLRSEAIICPKARANARSKGMVQHLIGLVHALDDSSRRVVHESGRLKTQRVRVDESAGPGGDVRCGGAAPHATRNHRSYHPSVERAGVIWTARPR